MTLIAGEEPMFTNYRDIFVGTIDYIWVKPGRPGPLRVDSVLGMISCAEARNRAPGQPSVLGEGHIPQSGGLGDGPGLPNGKHPSDHLPIAANLDLFYPIGVSG